MNQTETSLHRREMPADLEAFVLIGGRSSRFGSDKALAMFGSDTLAARAVKTIRSALAPVSVHLVAGSGNQFLADSIPLTGCDLITDPQPGQGAWSGVHAALQHASTEWIVVLACDLPLVSGELLSLLDALRSSENDAVVPRQSDGRLQPLCAFYKVATCLAAIRTLITCDLPLPPLSSMFDGLRVRVVESSFYDNLENADHLFTNVNTVPELQRALHLQSRL